MQKSEVTKNIIKYYAHLESKWGYRLLLKGNRHFGYYPNGNNKISFEKSQSLMQEKLVDKISLKHGLILDAGCGEGNTAFHLAKNHLFHVNGIDLLNESIKIAKGRAKKRNIKNISFQTGDYSEIDLGKDKYDVIYTMESLVHVKNYKKALRKFFTALKKGGRLVLFEYTLTDFKNLLKTQQLIWSNVCKETAMAGLREFSHGSYPEILKSVGFKNVEVEEITTNVFPMLQRFYKLARIPYFFIKLFKQEIHFPNTFFSVEAYKDIVKNKTWKYVIVTARKG